MQTVATITISLAKGTADELQEIFADRRTVHDGRGLDRRRAQTRVAAADDARNPVLGVLTEGTRPHEMLNNVNVLESPGAPTIGFSSIDGAEKYLDETFEVPALGELEPLVTNVNLQLFAYHVARSKGRSIDKPRNLAKSVTVE